MLYVFYLALGTSDVFEVQRVKNKLADETLPEQSKTNILVNAKLLYPASRDAFSASPLFDLDEPFDDAQAGKPIISCEIQLTLHDFLMIKGLLHSYYDVQRSPDPNYILSHPMFVDSSLEELDVPAVRRQPLHSHVVARTPSKRTPAKLELTPAQASQEKPKFFEPMPMGDAKPLSSAPKFGLDLASSPKPMGLPKAKPFQLQSSASSYL